MAVSEKGHELRQHNRQDFLTYQLPFDYDPKAQAPKFFKFLGEVLPARETQLVLTEYIGYVLAPSLKLEKVLILYGSGANGKSVFFDIITALFGQENTCNYSLQNLTKQDSYQRAELEHKLVNYASEINGKLEASVYKQLASGEPVEAREIYGKPFTMTNYARLIFNCNELPRETEQTHAFFRRFLIIPFDVVIPSEKQDSELARKIIADELPGVLNCALEGLDRLLKNRRFTPCEAIDECVKQYQQESDSVAMFIEEKECNPDINGWIALGQVYQMYADYCRNNGYRLCSNRTFSNRLKSKGFEVSRSNGKRFVRMSTNEKI